MEKANSFIVDSVGEEKFVNVRCLVNACMIDNYEIVKTFVKHGFHLR